MAETYTLIDIIKAAHEFLKKSLPSKRNATIHFVEDLTGYTLHFGGGCPVDKNANIRTVLAWETSGNWNDSMWRAGSHGWGTDGPNRVLAYLVIDPPKPKVDRSLRDIVIINRNGLCQFGIAWNNGVTVFNLGAQEPHLWTWSYIEDAGWEVYKP